MTPLLALGLSLLLAGGAQQRDTTTPMPPSATLGGRVTALDTGKPVRRAQVTISAPELSPNKAVSTDAEGRWMFPGLPAGRYTITITRPGFVTLAYGQRRPFESGTPVQLAEGQALTKLDMTLPRAAAISGRVVDEAGEPFARVRVSAQRLSYDRGGRRLAAVGETVSTDDVGYFRLYGLSPGDYYVAANPLVGYFGRLTEDRHGYLRTFYPSALSVSEATRLTLTTGQEASEILISLSPSRLVNVSGTLVDSTGKRVPRASGSLRPAGAKWWESGFEVLVDEGKWTASGVPPGQYTLSLETTDRRELMQETFSVGAENIGDLAFSTTPAGSVTGRLVAEEGVSLQRLVGTYLYARDPDDVMGGGFGTIQPDGTFRIAGLSGQRVFRPAPSSESGAGPTAVWILKSVTHNGADVTDRPIATPLGTEVSGLVVTITGKTAALSGAVQTAKGEATIDYAVILFAADPARRGPSSRFTRTARPDSNGRFTVTTLPAGDYLAAAVEDVEPGQETDPEFIERLAPTATSVTLTEGEKKTVTLKLPAR